MEFITKIFKTFLILQLFVTGCNYVTQNGESGDYIKISKEVLKDKIKGAWAAQTIGVTYGGPTEFRYLKRTIPDSIEIVWSDTTLYYWMTKIPALYDDIYMDLTFVEVMEREGIDAPASSHALAYANAKYWLWHANQQGRYNVLNGIMPPESGHWINNPHADDIDFQIEADFAGIMSPGMPNTAMEICDRVGHIMNYGDGFYGGVFVAAMYSYAFIEDNIDTVIKESLSMIPEETTYYRCLADVIEWHMIYPDDWRTTWTLLEEKWGTDIGCPDGAFEDFNIDAKMNSAYVILGLLYGNGDFGKTMEISTRAGQDSDCNPATAAAILGTMQGYDKIPKYWSQGLASIEDLDFEHTSTSLNDAYEISYRHALELIEKNGGEIMENEVIIRLQEPETAPLEQSFPSYALSENIPVNKRIGIKDMQELEIEFSGIGLVLKGRARHVDYDDEYALLTEAQTLDNYKLLVEFQIDGQVYKTMKLPLYFIERAHELFFQYELPQGNHRLILKILNPHEKVYLDVQNMITYERIVD